MDYPLWKSANLGFFYGLKRLIFSVQLYQTLFLVPFCIKIIDGKSKPNSFDKNHGLTPMEKRKFIEYKLQLMIQPLAY